MEGMYYANVGIDFRNFDLKVALRFRRKVEYDTDRIKELDVNRSTKREIAESLNLYSQIKLFFFS